MTRRLGTANILQPILLIGKALGPSHRQLDTTKRVLQLLAKSQVVIYTYVI
jgi:hypothetical protein